MTIELQKTESKLTGSFEGKVASPKAQALSMARTYRCASILLARSHIRLYSQERSTARK